MDELIEKQIIYDTGVLKKELLDTFILFFVVSLGSYRNFIIPGSFAKEQFVSSLPAETQPVCILVPPLPSLPSLLFHCSL